MQKVEVDVDILLAVNEGQPVHLEEDGIFRVIIDPQGTIKLEGSDSKDYSVTKLVLTEGHWDRITITKADDGDESNHQA